MLTRNVFFLVSVLVSVPILPNYDSKTSTAEESKEGPVMEFKEGTPVPPSDTVTVKRILPQISGQSHYRGFKIDVQIAWLASVLEKG